MASFDLRQHSHRRFNPLTGEWVLVSPHRTQRPWLGQVEKNVPEGQPQYDASCYMCPGNVRANGVRNPGYSHTFVFENDYAALTGEAPIGQLNDRDLLVASPESGMCRVVCFSPRHDLTIPRMELQDIRRVVDVWTEQYQELGAVPTINHVQIFENRGAMMGASNPHPHCQIWGNATIPNEPAREQKAQQEYSRSHRACLLCQYLSLEQGQGSRLVFENEHFLVLVPFWAVWPFETMVLPRRHLGSLPEVTTVERDSLASTLKTLTTCYDRLFESSFPYSMGFHQSPTDSSPHPEWHLHIHFYPPLLRSATVRKFMVGYELLGMPQRDITPEAAVERLRSCF